MGCWGYKLYQDDLAQDVRDAYVDLLHRGKTGEEAAEEILARYRDLDESEEPVFWFALADTQWNHGRLTEPVKAQALKQLAGGANQRLWERECPKEAAKRAAVLSELEKRLLSPQPEARPVKPHKLYQCPWKSGDVFARCLDGAEAKEGPYAGRYVFFVKVDECSWYPGHRIPVVYFFRAATSEPLSLEELKKAEFLPQFFVPEVYQRKPETKRLYRVALVSTSTRAIPKKLMYLGNMGPVPPIENEDPGEYALLWKRFEAYTLRNLSNWGIQ